MSETTICMPDDPAYPNRRHERELLQARLDRLAAIERDVRELADSLREEAARRAFHEYEAGLRDKAEIVEEHLRSILEPET